MPQTTSYNLHFDGQFQVENFSMINKFLGINAHLQNIVKEIIQYQKKWLQHVQRMDTNRLPKLALQYKPKG